MFLSYMMTAVVVPTVFLMQCEARSLEETGEGDGGETSQARSRNDSLW